MQCDFVNVLTFAPPAMLGPAFELAGLLYIQGMRSLYFRLFLRIVNRNRDVYILKILTLSVAFACAIVISLFVFNEFGYDKFHSNSDSAFRVLEKNNSDGFIGNRYSNQIHTRFVNSLSLTFGDSLTLSSVKVMDGLAIIAGNRTWHGQKLHSAEPSIIDIFTFDVEQGDVLRSFGVRRSRRRFGSPGLGRICRI